MDQINSSIPSILVGSWTYRSFLSITDINTEFNDLEFGRGTIVIEESPLQELKGTIGGTGWSLDLKGSIAYGNPFTLQFQGKGLIGGAEWKYNYVGYLVPDWVNGESQIPALVGSIVRVIPHPTGPNSQSTAPAGVVAQWIAVKQDAS